MFVLKMLKFLREVFFTSVRALKTKCSSVRIFSDFCEADMRGGHMPVGKGVELWIWLFLKSFHYFLKKCSKCTYQCASFFKKPVRELLWDTIDPWRQKGGDAHVWLAMTVHARTPAGKRSFSTRTPSQKRTLSTRTPAVKRPLSSRTPAGKRPLSTRTPAGKRPASSRTPAGKRHLVHELLLGKDPQFANSLGKDRSLRELLPGKDRSVRELLLGKEI